MHDSDLEECIYTNSNFIYTCTITNLTNLHDHASCVNQDCQVVVFIRSTRDMHAHVFMLYTHACSACMSLKLHVDVVVKRKAYKYVGAVPCW